MRYSFGILLVLAGSFFFNPAGVVDAGAESSITDDEFANPSQSVQFDLPPVIPATNVTGDPKAFEVELRLSSMIVSPNMPEIDQWLVRCQPRDRSITITDYAPRTETTSELTSPIQIKKTSENTNSHGLGLDAAYGHLVGVNAAAERGKKQIQSVQFDRVAPIHAVTASGTINRGRGVYFKLRWTAQQILEGEKTFRLTFAVPGNWRGGLMDVSVIAQSQRSSFGWEREPKTVAATKFVVAVFRENDKESEAAAHALAESEFALRSQASKHLSSDFDDYSLPSMLRHVAKKLDPESDRRSRQTWLQRILFHQVDPHLDKEIRRLSIPIRVAILDYIDHRKAFLAISRQASGYNIAAITENRTASEPSLEQTLSTNPRSNVDHP